MSRINEEPLTGFLASARNHPFPQGERRKKGTYAPAVVTPPSTTIVCPVMKLEASEAR
jgi:hypothetical protein